MVNRVNMVKHKTGGFCSPALLKIDRDCFPFRVMAGVLIKAGYVPG